MMSKLAVLYEYPPIRMANNDAMYDIISEEILPCGLWKHVGGGFTERVISRDNVESRYNDYLIYDEEYEGPIETQQTAYDYLYSRFKDLMVKGVIKHFLIVNEHKSENYTWSEKVKKAVRKKWVK
jgi:hypothetical protein